MSPRAPRLRFPLLVNGILLLATAMPAQEGVIGERIADGLWHEKVDIPSGATAHLVWVEMGPDLLLWDPLFPVGVRALAGSTPATVAHRAWRYVVAPRPPLANWSDGCDLRGATLVTHPSVNISAEQAQAAAVGSHLTLDGWLRLQGGGQVVEVHALGQDVASAELVLFLPEQKMFLSGRQGADWSTALDGSSRGWKPGTSAEAQEVGSLRGSKVAIEMAAGQRPQLVFVGSRRSAEEMAQLKKLAPNVDYRAVASRSAAMQHAGQAHGVEAGFLSSEFLRVAPQLRWVQAGGAGVERYLADPALRDNQRIVFANMKATHGPAIADHAFAMLLTLTRRLRFHEDALRRQRWDRGSSLRPEALHGKTMLVVGLGGIGHEVARRARGFGMTVLATTRSPKPVPDYVDRLGLAADFEAMLPQADVVAICVPLTPETAGMFGRGEFAAMKKGSYLINVARGRICDSAALAAALVSGHLGGACLDVTDPEPLPAGHALWKAPNLVLTPHVSGRAEATHERKRVLFAENMRRFAAGEGLLNVVDKAAGY